MEMFSFFENCERPKIFSGWSWTLQVLSETKCCFSFFDFLSIGFPVRYLNLALGLNMVIWFSAMSHKVTSDSSYSATCICQSYCNISIPEEMWYSFIQI